MIETMEILFCIVTIIIMIGKFLYIAYGDRICFNCMKKFRPKSRFCAECGRKRYQSTIKCYCLDQEKIMEHIGFLLIISLFMTPIWLLTTDWLLSKKYIYECDNIECSKLNKWSNAHCRKCGISRGTWRDGFGKSGIKCLRCNNINHQTVRYCSRCGEDNQL